MERKLGVAISGGGHRATLWGLGVLMYLVDRGANQQVTTVTSVSGGSIANGVVGMRTNYRAATPAAFRSAVRPLLRHITSDGLFFYGSATNRYLISVLGAAALTAAAWSLIGGVVAWQGARWLLGRIGLLQDDPLTIFTAWPIGVSVALWFAVLVAGAWRYSGVWNPAMGILGAAGIVAGAALVAADAAATPFEWAMLPALAGIAFVATALTLLTLSAFGRRSRVAEAGLDRVHFEGAPLSVLDPHLDAPPGERTPATRHLICTTEMQSGIHAFFSGEFVYSYAFGISRRTAEIPLARAVQASAALPGAFAPRRIPAGRLGFEPAGGDPPARHRQMVLMDGGVYDNMADQWFVGLDRRRQRWSGPNDELIPAVDDLIVANASTGWTWRPMGALALRIHPFRETAALGRVTSVLYNTVGRRRRAHLVDTWRCDPDHRGAFVEVDDDPIERAAPHLADRVRAIAPEGGWAALVERSRTYPTVLRQIPFRPAMEILWHAYIVTALSADRFLGVEARPEDLPDLQAFIRGLELV